MCKHGIDRRGVGYDSYDTQKRRYNEYASYSVSQYGYEVWRCGNVDDNQRTYVHQLLAVAEGEDPHKVYSDEYHVHHENRVKWDNRPENISLVDAKEHMRIHAERGDTAMGKGRYDHTSDIRFPNELREVADEIAENTTLTKWEADLLVGYADGFSKTELTKMLNVSEQGVEARTNSIHEKWAKAENTVNVLEDMWGQ
jgi:hypothetical protein